MESSPEPERSSYNKTASLPRTDDMEPAEEGVQTPKLDLANEEKPVLRYVDGEWVDVPRISSEKSAKQERLPGISDEASATKLEDSKDKELPPVPPGDSESAASGSIPASPTRRKATKGTATTRSSSNASTARKPMQSSAVSMVNGLSTFSSNIFVIQALESIAGAKETRRNRRLFEALSIALTAIKSAGTTLPPDAEVVFEPLAIACQTQNAQLTITALDCIGKLISYSYFSVNAEARRSAQTQSKSIEDENADSSKQDNALDESPVAPIKTPLIERAIETICDCFQGDSTNEGVQLQIIKSLLAAVLNDKTVVHGAGLLKAVRQTYNIFLLSKSSPNQMTAQGTLTQMVHTIFERVKAKLAVKESSLKRTLGAGQNSKNGPNASSTTIHIPMTPAEDLPPVALACEVGTPVEAQDASAQDNRSQEKITLQSFENRKSFDDERIADTTTVTISATANTLRMNPSSSGASTEGQPQDGVEDEDEIFVKDAFLVFRAMCKLSIKHLPLDQLTDLKSHGMRSKLLSLHLIHTILKTHTVVFTHPLVTIRSSSSNEPTQFVDAIKQYLCLSLSRNAASAVVLVFEVCCEIFWLVLRDLRVMLKKEIEVFLKEIYLAILDNRNSSVQQKQYLLGVLQRLCADPRVLVEMYLNYDCDRSALDNIFQRIIEHLSRISITPVQITEVQQQAFREHHAKASASNPHQLSLPPSLSTATMSAPGSNTESPFPVEYSLKSQSLECLVRVLQSLVTWSQKGMADAAARLEEFSKRKSEEIRESVDFSQSHFTSPRALTPSIGALPSPSEVDVSGLIVDDPNELEKAKQRKIALNEAIKLFNYKPKRGIKALIEKGFIKSKSPEDIAKFLLNSPQLSKAMIGEYLGEGDPENVAIMHAFVDFMEFTKIRFVDALRRFLQSFRLPGEAQKIDRFMLKFAERYITDNPNAFANADTAYVLAYSVIMLNTDLHSEKLKGKARMTKEEFIKNNRGINENKNLPDDYLGGIYDEIQHSEIVLEGERDAAALQSMVNPPAQGLAAGIGQALATVGRDLQKEAYVQASEEMANKTEQLFRSLLRAQRRSNARPSSVKFIPASSFRHVGPMFEITWMSFLSGLSGSAQDSNDLETIRRCMEGFKLAIRIACLFDLETARIAFVTALAKFTHLNNLSEMKPKNVEALKVLLEVAQTEGNLLKSSWIDVLTCISQLERFQLISAGVDEGSLPDVTKGRYISVDNAGDNKSRASMQSQRSSRNPRQRSQSSTHYSLDVAEESRSREVVIAVDRIFASTSTLSGEAIVYFVRALSEVSWQEIQSSGQSEHPRMFSLQKLVEISYYNMGRIRMEWSNIWSILGEHFNQVGCHSNTSVVFFALDSLRQLSMRFLEIEELPHFKFQKDFLKPFEHVMANSSVVRVKDMVLRCLNQMIQARGNNIRSGWRTMFGVFTYAAKESYDSIVNLAFEAVRGIYKDRFGVIIQQGAFADMIICITEFAKNHKFQKVSLQAIETLKATIPNMLSCPECPLSYLNMEEINVDAPNGAGAVVRTNREDPMIKFWFPVLFAFHDILMAGDELEARTRALGYLFDTLVKYGGDFPTDFWDIICQELLFPIFLVLKSRSEMTHFSTHEAIGMWLSTTMIQALRNLIALFTHYFSLLERRLDGFLDLLVTCTCQENDTIARIGSSCLQQLILQNVKKLRQEHWTKIVSAFVQLFETTTADQLFSAATGASGTNGRSHSAGTAIKGGVTEDENGEGGNSLKINGLAEPNLDDSDSVSPTSSKADSPEYARRDKETQDTSASTLAAQPSTTDLEDYKPQPTHQQQPVVTAARRKFFNKIITKCVLQLLMIETVSELFSNDAVYDEIPSKELLRLMGLLKKSFTFARRFNGDKELRMRLWREGFMKQPPNLLKQESGSAATYVSILFRMYHDDKRERRESREAIEAALIPLCVDIIRGYVVLDEETQQRNIVAWRPVVVDVMEGYTNFPTADFERHIDTFFPLIVDLLNRELGLDVRLALQNLLKRIGEVRGMGISPKGRERRRTMSIGMKKATQQLGGQ